jgi:hypothetical protein
MMTPFTFAQRYWYLPVPIVNQNNEINRWESVRVSKYRLAVRTSQNPETYDSVTTNALSEFRNVFQPFDNNKKNDATEEIRVFVKNADNSVETMIFKPADSKKLFRLATRAMWGKGTPEEVQITLQLAVRFGLINANQLQDYCDSGKVGLDCNGFVGTYMRDILGKSVEGNSLISSLFQQGRPINSLDEIDEVSIYIFGLVDGSNTVIPQYSGGHMGHVMITNPHGGITGTSQYIGEYKNSKKFYRRLTVIESTGGSGLVESDYLLMKCVNGVFTVFRGCKQSSIPVRISRVWI